MTDFAIDTSRTEPRIDTRWRASKFGQDHAQPGTLDLSTFVEGTHYNIGGRTDNVIPSGVALTKNATSGLYEPWTPGASAEDHPNLAGFINDDAGIELFRRTGVAKSTKAAFALLIVGGIDATRLPVSAQRAPVQVAPTTGLFTFI